MYDVIVVGARCAGSPTAMLLARKGDRVLLADKATFPSDIINGYFLHGLSVRFGESGITKLFLIDLKLLLRPITTR